jgi:hypothetical protein
MNKSVQLLLAATTVLAAACQKDDRPIQTASAAELNTSASDSSVNARGHSQVRVVNAVNGGKDIAVRIGEVTLFNEVRAGAVTDYRETALNIARFTVQASGASDGVMVSEKDRLLLDGNRYTVFLIAEDVSRSALRVVRDNVSPDSGKARIRIIHAAYGAPEFDIGVMGAKDKLFTGVNFKSEAGFKDVAPATINIAVTATKGAGKVLLSIPKLHLDRGTATTIVITGSNKLAYFTFTDEPIGAPKK